MAATYTISQSNLVRFLDALKTDYEVVVPVKRGNARMFVPYKTFTDDIVIGEVRTCEPLKVFFFRAHEKVAEGFSPEIPAARSKPYCIVGAKACDLKGFAVQDHVFKSDGVEDPFYVQARENNLIISADCTCAIDTCFCVALDERPYPRHDFDLNLSELDSGFLVEVGSEKGRAVLSKQETLFEEAKEQSIASRDHRRAEVTERVEQNVREHDLPHQDAYAGIVERNYKSDLWADEAKTCVECGACNTICPTCHCFLLCDQDNQERVARFRLWDSCMLKDFARVAGGGNPRPHLWMRLRNRFEKKFDFFPKIAGLYACTGCGRCISACPAKIDIRAVLRRLVTNVSVA